MKPSHLRTPRTIAECHFQPGYKCADREPLTYTWVCAAVLALALALAVVL